MNSIKDLALDQDKLNALKANEQALRQEIQRAEQAAREQEKKREREALLNAKKLKKNEHQNLINQLCKNANYLIVQTV